MGEGTTIPRKQTKAGALEIEKLVWHHLPISNLLPALYYYYPDAAHALNGTEKTIIPNTQMWAKIHVQ